MKNVQIILHKNQEVAETYNVKEGKVLTIQNIRGVNYELYNTLNGTAPQNIIARRVGQDLIVILDENEGAGSPLEINPDIIIKDYYGDIEEEKAEGLDKVEGEVTDATGILIGLHENGNYYAYIPESAQTSDAISILEDGDAEPQAIGGEELSCAVFFPWWGLLPLLALIPFFLHDHDDEPEAPELIPPSAVNDEYSAKVNQPVDLKPLDKDTDDDLATLKIKSINGVELTGQAQVIDIPDKGKVNIDADGKITFTPSVSGKVEFPYVIVDKDGQESTANEIITVTPVSPNPQTNIPPVAINDVEVGTRDATTGKLNSVKQPIVNDDVDPDGTGIDPKTVEIVGGTKGGKELVVAGEGTWTVDKTTGEITFTPEPTFNGNPTEIKYTVKDNDGAKSNEATVKVTYPEVTPSIEITKVDTPLPANAKVDDFIEYTFKVTNTGKIALKEVFITDGNATNVTWEKATLAVGETITGKAKHKLTQEDFDAGKVENVATVTAKDIYNTPVTDKSDDTDDVTNSDPNGDGNPDDPTVTPLTQDPELKLLKVAVVADTNGDQIVGNAGDTITYTFTVENIGNVTVSNIKVSDDRIGVTDLAVTPDSLAPKGTATATADYVITDADVKEGKIENSATATGQDPKGNDVSDVSDDPKNPADVDPNNDGNPDDPTVTPLVQPLPKLTDANKELVEATGDNVTDILTVEHPEFVKTLTVNGKDITTASAKNPVIIEGNEGTLKVLGFNKQTGDIIYKYTEDGNAETHTKPANDNVKDIFTIAGTTTSGQAITDATLTVKITDTQPIANPDKNTVKEDTTTQATGNVITENDIVNADKDVTVTGVAKGNTGTDESTNVGTAVQGKYGTITINPNGTYTYDLDNTNADVQALNDGDTLKDTFTYTIVDKDGDKSTTTITIDVDGKNELNTPVNVPPVAVSDEAEGKRDPQTGKLQAKKQPIVNDDIDPDGTIDKTSVELVKPDN
ncbi:MAG: VCBS domain-containing protein, partial [Pasteurella sp.]|nr:VCBS domain-containing protein [Pasteurella sp.]